MEVIGRPCERDPGRDGLPSELTDLAGNGDADGVSETHFIGPELQQLQADLDGPAGLDAAGVGAAEGGRNVGSPPPAQPRQDEGDE